MVLEATMFVLDNSEWMRNGDYVPSRMEAQNDAVHLIFSAKTQSNPENTCGLMTMAGKSPQVKVTMTNEIGKILSATHSLKLHGKIQFSTSLQIAALALKHRENKNQRQRIICFIASPIDEHPEYLNKLAKKLKKNNVSVDIVVFGEFEDVSKLEGFIETINANDQSHLVHVPPGSQILSDVLLSSAIVQSEGSSFSNAANFEFGVDPSLDPELAMALRLSMEEENQRLSQSQSQSQGNAQGQGQAQGAGAGVGESKESSKEGDAMDVDEEEALQKALQMSMEQNQSEQKKK